MTFPHLKHMHSKLVSFSFFHANMQNGFSLFFQLKLGFEVILWCSSCPSGFSRYMVTFLGYHLNFQNLFVITNNNLIFFYIKTLISKKFL